MKIWLPVCLLACAFSVTAAATPAPAPTSGTVLITGSDRGIGLALTRDFALRGWRVIATCRDPGNAAELAGFAHDHSSVSIEKLDVSDNAAIDALAARLKGQPIDVLSTTLDSPAVSRGRPSAGSIRMSSAACCASTATRRCASRPHFSSWSLPASSARSSA